jgi:hypothetical protein
MSRGVRRILSPTKRPLLTKLLMIVSYEILFKVERGLYLDVSEAALGFPVVPLVN